MSAAGSFSWRNTHEGYAPASRPPPVDPLTDSASHRLGLGTQVRLHLYREAVDVGLLAIRDCSTWDDLVARIDRNMTIEVMASRRRVFTGGVILWAEVLSDPIEEVMERDTPEGVGTYGTLGR